MKTRLILIFCFAFFAVVANAQTLPAYLKDNSLEKNNPSEWLLKSFSLVSGGTYTHFSDGEDGINMVATRITLTSFYLQKYEVTNKWYRMFLYDLGKNDVKEALKMMPDTACWVKDFQFSYNEPMKLLYFKHAAYDNYPVVGVNYYQATAFSKWANEKLQQYLQTKNIKGAPVELRLPMEAEWQYAAAGSLDKYFYGFKPTSENFSSNGVFVLYDTRTKKFRANYKTDEGYYIGDGFMHTGPVGSYPSNAYGIFDLIGNVSEWTANLYSPNDGSFDYAPAITKTATDSYIVKGGSWADDYKKQRINCVRPTVADSSHSYIGFRLAASVKSN